MGASWNKKPSGSYGIIGCFSTQTYKHINSGEGGLITTNDPEIMAKSIALSGSYMMFEKHLSAPIKPILMRQNMKRQTYRVVWIN